MIQKKGRHTLEFTDMPKVIGAASVAGKKESEGPIAEWFDKTVIDTTMGGETWEKAEAMFQKEALTYAIEKSGIKSEDIDYVFAGDLLNQCVSSSSGLRDFGIPFMGQYGACSTMAQTIACASVFTESGAADICAAVTSSHFCSAERQFRLPLQYGGQRTPTAQWTVTGSGSMIISRAGNCDGQIAVKHVCTGKIIDMGIKDANNMGAAMAGAAADTIYRFLSDTETTPHDYDLIITGDLGLVGTELLYELLEKQNIDIRANHKDCGLMIFDREKQDVHAGGSGCGCSASVLCSYFYKNMIARRLNNILFIATGALMSPTIVQQGESISGIAHLINFVNE